MSTPAVLEWPFWPLRDQNEILAQSGLFSGKGRCRRFSCFGKTFLAGSGRPAWTLRVEAAAAAEAGRDLEVVEAGKG